MTRIGAVTAALVAAAVLAACGSDDEPSGSGGNQAASGDEVETLKIALGSSDPSSAPLFLALHEGYFDKEGLKVTVEAVGPNVNTSVVSGQVDIGVSNPGGAMSVANEGAETSIIFKLLGNGFAAFGVGAPEVKEFSDCKNVVTNALGTTAYAWAVASKGIFNADYEVIAGGNTPDAVQAILISGRADCGMGNYAFFGPLVDQGKLHVLVDPSKPETLPAAFPQGVTEGAIWGVKEHLQERRGAIEKFIRAITTAYVEMVKPASVTNQQLADTLASYPEFKAFPKDSIEPIVTIMRPFSAPDDGYISAESWPITLDLLSNGGLDFLSTTDPKWSYENRVDMSYYDAGVGKPTS